MSISRPKQPADVRKFIAMMRKSCYKFKSAYEPIVKKIKKNLFFKIQ